MSMNGTIPMCNRTVVFKSGVNCLNCSVLALCNCTNGSSGNLDGSNTTQLPIVHKYVPFYDDEETIHRHNHHKQNIGFIIFASLLGLAILIAIIILATQRKRRQKTKI